MKNNKGFTSVEVLTVVLIVAVIGFAGWYVGKNMSKEADSTATKTASSNTKDPELKSSESMKMTIDEKELITAAVKSAFPQWDNLEVPRDTIEVKNNFARGSAGSEGSGGFAWITKKIDDTWKVVVSGQELPSKEDGEKYDLPNGWYSTEY